MLKFTATCLETVKQLTYKEQIILLMKEVRFFVHKISCMQAGSLIFSFLPVYFISR